MNYLPGLNRDDVYRLGIVLPLPEDQRRIAAILDQADAIRTKRRQVLDRLDGLAQSAFHEMFGEGEFEHRKIGSFCRFYSGGTPSKAVGEYWNGSIPWFSSKDLKAPDLFDSADHISDVALGSSSLRLLPEGTIVVAVRGMILAHTFPISVLRVESTINQDLKAVIPAINMDVDFLVAAIRDRAAWVLARASTAAHGTKKVDLSVLQSIPIPLPPLGLQRQFAARVEAINAQRARVESALAADDELFASLQSRAFNGEL